MDCDWDCFIRQVDKKTAASIVLDLNACKCKRQNLARVSKAAIDLKSPKRDGLSSAAEAEKLEGAEDAFETYVQGTGQGRYVGRITVAGKRVFYGYVPDSVPLGRSQQKLGDYDAALLTDEDADWQRFRTELYPTDEELQCIKNRRVVDNLQSHGDDLSRPRETDHWACFANPGDAAAFRTATREQGYRVRKESVVQGRIRVQVYRVEHVDQEAIDASTLALFRLAKAHHGSYDGWETFMVNASRVTGE